MVELTALFDNEVHVMSLLHKAIEKLKYSDEILAIYKYLHK